MSPSSRVQPGHRCGAESIDAQVSPGHPSARISLIAASHCESNSSPSRIWEPPVQDWWPLQNCADRDSLVLIAKSSLEILWLLARRFVGFYEVSVILNCMWILSYIFNLQCPWNVVTPLKSDLVPYFPTHLRDLECVSTYDLAKRLETWLLATWL